MSTARRTKTAEAASILALPSELLRATPNTGYLLFENQEGQLDLVSAEKLDGWIKLVAAIRRVLAGERGEDELCAGLDLEDSMILEAILRGLEDPSTLQDLLPAEGKDAD